MGEPVEAVAEFVDDVLNVPKMEAAADKVLELCRELRLTREEVAGVASAVWLNHAIATGVREATAATTVREFYAWRRRVGLPEAVLVPERPQR